MRPLSQAQIQYDYRKFGHTKRPQVSSWRTDHVITQGEVTIYKPRREASGETKLPDTGTSDF